MHCAMHNAQYYRGTLSFQRVVPYQYYTVEHEPGDSLDNEPLMNPRTLQHDRLRLSNQLLFRGARCSLFIKKCLQTVILIDLFIYLLINLLIN